MAYVRYKNIHGNRYAYLQESYREGGKVKTRHVRYIGGGGGGGSSGGSLGTTGGAASNGHKDFETPLPNGGVPLKELKAKGKSGKSLGTTEQLFSAVAPKPILAWVLFSCCFVSFVE